MLPPILTLENFAFCFWQPAMQGTIAPKAAINKHSQALLGKNEAQPAEQLCATSPALNRVSFQH